MTKATSTVEKVKVDMTNYESFWGMLTSPDKENSVVALSILNNAEFKESLPYILLLYKGQDEASRRQWQTDAPDTFKKLSGLGVDSSTNLSYKKIIELVKNQCTPEGLQFVLNKFSVVLSGYLCEWGFDFIKELGLELSITLPKEKTSTNES